jgi:hypothetical protein
VVLLDTFQRNVSICVCAPADGSEREREREREEFIRSGSPLRFYPHNLSCAAAKSKSKSKSKKEREVCMRKMCDESAILHFGLQCRVACILLLI